MATHSKTETGHAVNVDHFEKLKNIVKGEASYNPADPNLTILNLEATLTSEKNAVDDLIAAKISWKNAVNKREIAFDPLSRLVTKIVNAAAACEVSEQFIADLKSLQKKIQGVRSSPAIEVLDDPETPDDETFKSISASQMGYVNRTDNFNMMVQMLAGEPNYLPNEVEVQVVTLQAYLADLQAANTKVNEEEPAVISGIEARNDILYKSSTSGNELQGKVKKYAKAVFGTDNHITKRLLALKFTKPKGV